ncbi:adenylate/guanylate cyclase domain-containing protein [Chthonobacter rhizosphaerae]|uniref:adenylate/guanylate cyclase domain-containing protein n=1 Tax=Chthonobacter rhizosphaerae TaxID=2735553 RepID=UPI0015EF0045|nr:adenylate/guanylate cyclase domain-containing protein [Chthonobacter rhizosphaerae]
MAADVANFGGLVSVDETSTLEALWVTRRIAREELAIHGGWLFGLPGDGIFALFESAVDAVRCALETQARLAAAPGLDALRLRVGVHLGEVLFQDDLPFGEALVIASRLESLADPGGILVSAAVMEAVAPRISADFTERGVVGLKHSPRRVAIFSVSTPRPGTRLDLAGSPLDVTMAPARRADVHGPTDTDADPDPGRSGAAGFAGREHAGPGSAATGDAPLPPASGLDPIPAPSPEPPPDPMREPWPRPPPETVKAAEALSSAAATAVPQAVPRPEPAFRPAEMIPPEAVASVPAPSQPRAVPPPPAFPPQSAPPSAPASGPVIPSWPQPSSPSGPGPRPEAPPPAEAAHHFPAAIDAAAAPTHSGGPDGPPPLALPPAAPLVLLPASGSAAVLPAPVDPATIPAAIPAAIPTGGPAATPAAGPAVVSLPEATPLVVPDHPPPPHALQADETLEATAPIDLARAAFVLPDDVVDDLVQALTVHIGPVARMLVERQSRRIVDPLDLVESLALEIPAAVERLQFLARARRAVRRVRH